MRSRWFIGGIALSLLSGCVVEQEPGPVEEDLTAAWEEMNNPDLPADQARCSGVIVPDRGPFNKRIALTFDDGPNLTNTPQVLDTLAAHNATATFFINGRVVTSEAHWELLRRMKDEGHVIGNHTQNHPNSREISSSAFVNEVEGVHSILEELGVEEDRLFFRFPYGSSNCSTYETVTSYGYNVTGWHIDTADWCFANSREGVGYCSPSTFRYVPDSYRDDYVGFTLSQARSNGGGVLLMHDVHSFTVGQLDALMTALEAEGFTFVGIDDVSTFPLLNGEEPEAQPWVGTPCTTEDECSFNYGEDREGYCASFELASDPETLYGFCGLPCEGTCPDRYGHATTFCVESSEPGVGTCVAKAEEANSDCADIPGTVATERERFIGSSGVSPSTATVCLPAE